MSDDIITLYQIDEGLYINPKNIAGVIAKPDDADPDTFKLVLLTYSGDSFAVIYSEDVAQSLWDMGLRFKGGKLE